MAECSSAFAYHCVVSELGGACGLGLDECRYEDLLGSIAQRVVIGWTEVLVIASWRCAFCVGWSCR